MGLLGALAAMRGLATVLWKRVSTVPTKTKTTATTGSSTRAITRGSMAYGLIRSEGGSMAYGLIRCFGAMTYGALMALAFPRRER